MNNSEEKKNIRQEKLKERNREELKEKIKPRKNILGGRKPGLMLKQGKIRRHGLQYEMDHEIFEEYKRL